jgi:hypothetical protein
MSQILRFQANTPVQVALKFDGGRDVDGRYGPQVLYTLADGRLMYLEPKAARHIDELKIKAGELFSICKREVKNGQKSGIQWEVKRVEPIPKPDGPKLVPPASVNTSAAVQSSRSPAEHCPGQSPQSSNGQAATPGLFNEPRPLTDGRADNPPETQLRASIPGLAKLEHALKTAIAAAAGAEQFGHEIGYEVRFAPVDIRAIAIDVLMNGSQDRPESTRKDKQS